MCVCIGRKDWILYVLRKSNGMFVCLSVFRDMGDMLACVVCVYVFIHVQR